MFVWCWPAHSLCAACPRTAVQADVCHAYQVLRNGGLKDENIVVFMYDDIARSRDNPYPGTIINSPQGPDVYQGVPKVTTSTS